MANPTPHTRPADLVPRAWREALSMAGAGPDPGRGQDGDLTAAALRAHRALSAGFGHSVGFTALGPGGDSVRGLAAFLAVYAAEQRAAQELGMAA
ncbi:hypothetical protein CW362_41245 [Streptomyces populi]|uniref:Uncharacterized protein n=1 Tax=Streptomyces populi TaxID=2058924 RepID=A0A2I0SBH5_9ACTN|nr:hypothetical protein [Streptomyces populi]PKT67297.1 hypothetical protein CW362_41245 [Streptomyces populi]